MQRCFNVCITSITLEGRGFCTHFSLPHDSSHFNSVHTAPDLLTRKHKLSEVEWLFDTLKLTSYENKIRSVDELIQDIQQAISSIEEHQATLNEEVFSSKPFDHLEKQQAILKVIIDILIHINLTNALGPNFVFNVLLLLYCNRSYISVIGS